MLGQWLLVVNILVYLAGILFMFSYGFAAIFDLSGRKRYIVGLIYLLIGVLMTYFSLP